MSEPQEAFLNEYCPACSDFFSLLPVAPSDKKHKPKCPTGQLLAEVDRLQGIINGMADRIAAQAALLSRNAERDALGRLEAWRQETRGLVFITDYGSHWMVLLPSPHVAVIGRARQADDKPLDRFETLWLHDGATLAETILAALDLWRQRYGEG